jgi:hypothetical protein
MTSVAWSEIWNSRKLFCFFDAHTSKKMVEPRTNRKAENVLVCHLAWNAGLHVRHTDKHSATLNSQSYSTRIYLLSSHSLQNISTVWAKCSLVMSQHAIYTASTVLRRSIITKLHASHQWRTQEFFFGEGFNKFGWGQGAERTGIWGRYPVARGSAQFAIEWNLYSY